MKRPLLLLALVLLAACRATIDPTAALGSETRIVFEGVRAFSEEELLVAIDADRYGAAPERATRAMVDDAAYAVEEVYRADGFADVTVEYEILPDDTEDTAILRVEEGPRLTLTQAAFEGNASIDGDTLALFFLPDDQEERPFVRSKLRSAASSIEEYYYQKGWLRARVTSMEPEIDAETGAVRVVCTVDEGPRFLVRAVSVESAPGSAPIDPAVHKELDRAIGRQLERRFVPSVGYGLRAALVEAYGRRGHPDADAALTVTLDEETGDVELALSVTPGPLVMIDEVRVEGREDVRRSLVTDRLELSEGDRYDSAKIRGSFANLYRSGYFRSVRIDLEESADSSRDLIVSVDELPSLELFVEPGYGSYEGPRVSLGVDERNFLQTGTGLRAEATVGALAQGVGLAWTDPWIDRGRFAARVGLSGDKREEPSFTEIELGTELSLARVWSQTLRTTVTYRFRRTKLEDVDLDANDPLVEDALEDVNIASLGLSTTLDDRDGLFSPRSGGRKRASIEWASAGLGSEIDFVAGNVEALHFYELSSDTVLALRFRAGLKAPIGATEALPIQERFFNGGENTVRSFPEDELGPLVNGQPAGGEAFNVFNVELRQDLVGSLQAGLFYDAGNVASQVGDYLDFDDVRHGVGLGLRYLLPIGPVRLDAAWNPSPRGDEDDVVLHFAIGMAF